MKYESRVEAGFRTRLCVCVCYRAFSPKSIISFRFFVELKKFRQFLFFLSQFMKPEKRRMCGILFSFFFKRRLPCSLKSNIFFPESNSMRNAINYIKRPQFNWHILDGKKFDDLITTDQRSTKTKTKIKKCQFEKRVVFVFVLLVFSVRSFVCSFCQICCANELD